MTINERIVFLIDLLENGTQRAFAKKTGIHTSTLSGIIGSRKSEPSFSVLKRIIDSYSVVSLNWLINEIGEPIEKSNNIQHYNINLPQTKVNNIIQRLDCYAQRMGLNDNKVTIEAGLSVGLLGKSRKNKGGLNSDSIEKILHAYPDINPEWFLTGKGEMQKTTNREEANIDQKLVVEMINEIKNMAIKNAVLKRKNKDLLQKINERYKDFK